MRTASQAEQKHIEAAGEKGFALDTSFVLFFLAVEFGQSFGGFSFERLFLAITLMAVAVLPYFTISGEKQEFAHWLLGRCLILGFAFLLGIFFKQALGVVLPAEFRFVPMTLLIAAAVFSCFTQFQGFFRFRLAK